MKFFTIVIDQKVAKEHLFRWAGLACQCGNPEPPQLSSIKDVCSWANKVIVLAGRSEKNPPISGIVIGRMLDIHPQEYRLEGYQVVDRFHPLNPEDEGTESLVLYWVGSWTKGRYVQIEVTEKSDKICLSVIGRTGTYEKSKFLSWWIERSNRTEIKGDGWQFIQAA